MLNDYFKEQIAALCRICLCNVSVLDAGKQLLFAYPGSNTLANDDPKLFSDMISFSEEEAFIYQENDCVHFGIIQKEGCKIIFGPFSTRKIDHAGTIKYLRRHHHDISSMIHIHTFSYQQNADLLKLSRTLPPASGDSTASRPAEEEEAMSIQIPSNAGLSDASRSILEEIAMNASSYRVGRSDEEFIHHPYRMEQLLADYVRNGDVDGLIKISGDPSYGNYSSGIMAKDPFKQAEYATVNAIQLFSRAAIDGGLNPYIAYDLSDLYLQKTAQARSEKEAGDILKAAWYDFTSRVGKVKVASNKSVYVRKCESYILQNITRNITLKDLANYAGITPNYLSAVFHESEGITLQEFILREKIAVACSLLLYSNRSISETAGALGFRSQSHFGEIFKRITGETPGNYRKKHATDN